jgi:aspartate carbamoyltransferase regulatory subunit
MAQPRQLSVNAIEQGIVIDHIQAGQALPIIHVFQLNKRHDQITIGLNLTTQTGLKKDLIKIENCVMDEDLAHGIAVFSPQATINLIEDFTVSKKITVSTPKLIQRVLLCPNPKCITNHEPDPSCFHVQTSSQNVILLCHYCEKKFELQDIKSFAC